MEFDAEKFGEWSEGATDQEDYHHWNNAEDLERLNWNQNSDCAVPGWCYNCLLNYARGFDSNPFLYNFPGPASQLGVPGTPKNLPILKEI